MPPNPLPSPNQESPDDRSLLLKAQEYPRIRETGRTPEAALISAWGEFFLLENARLQKFLSMTKAPQSERDDVAQEVWMEIVQNMAGFQGDRADEQLHLWMCKVIRSKVALVIRRRLALPTGSLHEMVAEPEDDREKADKSSRLTPAVRHFVRGSYAYNTARSVMTHDTAACYFGM